MIGPIESSAHTSRPRAAPPPLCAELSARRIDDAQRSNLAAASVICCIVAAASHSYRASGIKHHAIDKRTNSAFP